MGTQKKKKIFLKIQQSNDTFEIIKTAITKIDLLTEENKQLKNQIQELKNKLERQQSKKENVQRKEQSNSNSFKEQRNYIKRLEEKIEILKDAGVFGTVLAAVPGVFGTVLV